MASATVPRSTLLAVAHRSYRVEALFTSTSVRPNRPFTQSAIAATLIELSTSSWQATIRLPSGSSSLAASSPLRRSREPSTTPKPSRASCRHTSRPTPRLPPVTTATGRSKDTVITGDGHDREVSHGSHLAISRAQLWLKSSSNGPWRRVSPPAGTRFTQRPVSASASAMAGGRAAFSLPRRRGRRRGVAGGRVSGRDGTGVVRRELLQPVAQAAEHHVGRAPPDRPVQDHAALVEKQVIPEPPGLHLRDQHDHLLVLVLRLDVAEVLHDGLGD